MSEANVAMGAHAGALMEKSPFAIPSKKLAMWLFIMADVMTFAACLVMYGFLRNAAAEWPRPFHSAVSAEVMTFIMLTSCLTILIALRAAKAGDKAGAFLWTMITSVGGLIFAVLHIREWIKMIDLGVGLFHNPWGLEAFGSAYYVITGFSLLHISVGTIALFIVGVRYKSGRYNADDLEVMNLYWQFVTIVWLFIVPAVYLMNLAK